MRAFDVVMKRLRSQAKRVPGLKRAHRRVFTELAVLGHVVRNHLWSNVSYRRRLRSSGASQLPLRWSTSLASSDLQSFLEKLREADVLYREGAFTIYLPPQQGLAEQLGVAVSRYPADSGFKFLKDAHGPDIAKYVACGDIAPWGAAQLVGGALDLAPVANVLNDLDLGPRLYDVAEFAAGTLKLTVFVVQHVDGTTPRQEECVAFLRKLKDLERKKVLQLVVPDWESLSDFQCPECAGNLIRNRRDGALLYVDFQNFMIANHREYLGNLVAAAKSEVHFGQEVLFRGGRYLYQDIPGLCAPGKRDTSRRWQAIEGLLLRCEVRCGSRLILDVGCNTGMMLAQALNSGAYWALGWDKPDVVLHGRRILGALGYTRYDLIGASLDKNYPMVRDIPEHVRAELPESIVLYLAIRHHVGFLDALATMPWKYLVYEGGEHESREEFERVRVEFCMTAGCEMVASETIEDGDCSGRPLVLFRRRRTPAFSGA